jgi:hypothetical protein
LLTPFVTLGPVEEIKALEWVISVARVGVLTDVDYDNGGGNVIIYRLKSVV